MSETYIFYLRMIPFFLSLFLVLVLGRPTIAWLQKIGAGQRVRDDGPQRHLQKEGTPTMGGVLIIGAAIVASMVGLLIKNSVFSLSGWLIYLPIMVLALILYFAGIGFLDDWLKVARGRSLGLKARQKLLLQFIGAVLFYFIVIWLNRHDLVGWMKEVTPLTVFTRFAVTGAIWTIFLVGTSNAVNLADGLDGLATGLCFIGFIALALIRWNLFVEPVNTVALSFAGACLGFLWYNRHPAQLFMGDVGSLALGAALAGVAFWLVFSWSNWILIGICFVPYLEAASVIIQVISYKTTGKRVFKMSPLHHHFELSGWSEQKVVYTFWAVGAVAAAVTVWLNMR
jgi:phospho-N-acetylmuramoyl-pentapeptide-transferase